MRYKHGDFGTRLYRIWAGVKRRCNNPHMKAYPAYGGRGISVCEQWNEYVPFKEWAIANGYSDSLTLDRIDSDGNYEPDNCRWITMQEQAHNRRYKFCVTYHGVTKPLFEWAEEIGKSYRVLYNRITCYGYTVERAFEEPIIPRKSHRK